jgi:hypothetical protein
VLGIHVDNMFYFQAMYLVYKALDGETVPHILSSRLIPPSKRSLVGSSPNISPGVSPTPNMVSASVSHVSVLLLVTLCSIRN